MQGLIKEQMEPVAQKTLSDKPIKAVIYTHPHPEGSIRAPQVMENLIAKGELPVTIGIFIAPGNRSEDYPDDFGSHNPNNRAQEYDAMNDRYPRFIVDEMLPEVGQTI